jgi:hypothetical protein
MKVDVLGARHADRHQEELRHAGARLRRPHDAGGHPAGRPCRLRHAVRGRLAGRLPGREPGADEHAPPPAPAPLLRSVVEVAIVRPAPSRATWSTRTCVAARGWSRRIPRPRGRRPHGAAPRAGEDARRPALPGTGHAHRHRGGGLLPRRGQPAPPRHGHLPPRRHHRHAPRQAGGGHGRARLRSRLRRALLQADRGVRRVRLPRVPRRQLRLAGLRLQLDQAPPPRDLLRRPPQQPAYGLLRPRPDRPRRPRAPVRGPPPRHQRQLVGLHAGIASLRSVRRPPLPLGGRGRGWARRASAASGSAASIPGNCVDPRLRRPSRGWRRAPTPSPSRQAGGEPAGSSEARRPTRLSLHRRLPAGVGDSPHRRAHPSRALPLHRRPAQPHAPARRRARRPSRRRRNPVAGALPSPRALGRQGPAHAQARPTLRVRRPARGATAPRPTPSPSPLFRTR